MGFGVWGLGFGVWGLGFGVWGLGFGVWGLGFGVWGLGFGVWGLGFGVWGLGSRKQKEEQQLANCSFKAPLPIIDIRGGEEKRCEEAHGSLDLA